MESLRIKDARLAAGLTQKAMSDKLGIPIRTIQDWEHGLRTPPEWAARLITEKLENIKNKEDKIMKEYYINYNTGAGNEYYTGTIDEAKAVADAGAAYTQRDIDIYDGDTTVATRHWYGVAPDEEDEARDIIRFGSEGFYDEWQDF